MRTLGRNLGVREGSDMAEERVVGYRVHQVRRTFGKVTSSRTEAL